MRLLALLSLVSPLAAFSADPPLDLPRLEAEITAGRLPQLTSVIVSQDGRVIYEQYFGSGEEEHLNNTRSATKSLTALAMGRAIADRKIAGVDAWVMPFFDDLAAPGLEDPLKSDIRVRDLLTMSSALAADDSDPNSPGNEDRMHEQERWTQWGVNLPTRGDYRRDRAGYGPFKYATIDAVLAGQVLQRAVGRPVDEYIAETLFAPLGITQYRFQRSPSGEVMTGGGIELRAIDLWRIGEMVQEGGRFQGKQVLPAAWIRECLTVREPDTGKPKIGYGYLFWHTQFALGDRREDAWFMGGNGGNLVVILPDLRAVVVITRTAFNVRSAAETSMRIVPDFVLPALAGKNRS